MSTEINIGIEEKDRREIAQGLSRLQPRWARNRIHANYCSCLATCASAAI
jgi:hypothetical protein